MIDHWSKHIIRYIQYTCKTNNEIIKTEKKMRSLKQYQMVTVNIGNISLWTKTIDRMLHTQKKQSEHKMNSFVLENDKNDVHSKFDV